MACTRRGSRLELKNITTQLVQGLGSRRGAGALPGYVVNLVGVLALAQYRIFKRMIFQDLDGRLAIRDLFAGMDHGIKLPNLILDYGRHKRAARSGSAGRPVEAGYLLHGHWHGDPTITNG